MLFHIYQNDCMITLFFISWNFWIYIILLGPFGCSFVSWQHHILLVISIGLWWLGIFVCIKNIWFIIVFLMSWVSMTTCMKQYRDSDWKYEFEVKENWLWMWVLSFTSCFTINKLSYHLILLNDIILSNILYLF